MAAQNFYQLYKVVAEHMYVSGGFKAWKIKSLDAKGAASGQNNKFIQIIID